MTDNASAVVRHMPVKLLPGRVEHPPQLGRKHVEHCDLYAHFGSPHNHRPLCSLATLRLTRRNIHRVSCTV